MKNYNVAPGKAIREIFRKIVHTNAKKETKGPVGILREILHWLSLLPDARQQNLYTEPLVRRHPLALTVSCEYVFELPTTLW